MARPAKQITIHGKAISPGFAEGVTFLYQDALHLLDLPVAIDEQDVERELGKLDSATDSISDDLLVLATRVEKEMDARLAAVFDAHQLILNDPSLKHELQGEIRQNLVSASSAVKAVFLRWEKRFQLMESQVSRHKGDDMRDLSNRLSAALSGITVHPLERVPKGSILVAQRLLPSDTIFLSQISTAAVLLEYGGVGSHAALFAREMGLPCIAEISNIRERIPKGVYLLVDANVGEITLQPSQSATRRFRARIAAQKTVESSALKRAQSPAVTKDGVSIATLANVGTREDADRAVANGAEGVGLYRTERAYLGRSKPPTEEELFDEMRHTLAPFKGRPVCVRLLDIGADKPLPFIGFLAESNPALGRRGVRLLMAYPQLLDTQLRALLRLAKEHELSILAPMITVAADMQFVRDAMSRIASDLGIDTLPTLGAMIETPAAALSIADLVPLSDFFSIGTNDLAQYAFAADRENGAVEHYLNDSSPPIFTLMETVQAAAADRPVSVCGELAGRATHTSQLLKIGIRRLSIAPPLIPMIKETIRRSRCS